MSLLSFLNPFFTCLSSNKICESISLVLLKFLLKKRVVLKITGSDCNVNISFMYWIALFITKYVHYIIL